MSYSNLSIIERGQLETLVQLGLSLRAIARHLNRHPSTIAREIKRGIGDGKAYQASASQSVYEERRQSSKPIGKFTSELKAEIKAKLQQTWSPEQIAQKHRAEGNPWFASKRSIVGSTKAALKSGFTRSGTRESGKSPRRHADGLA